MAVPSSSKILLTGATGYIGGSILANLLSSSSPHSKNITITCLVRGSDRVTKLSSAYGDRVRPVLYESLDDIEATTSIAARHDVVINTTLGYHPASGAALVRGLAKRKASTGQDVWMIHTSGTSNLADKPFTEKYVETKEFDDASDNIYATEKKNEAKVAYAQRTAELGVIDAGLELGVNTLVIVSPTIFGVGAGLFNKTSIQLPVYIRGALGLGHAIVVGEGTGVWDHVHVKDLAELYSVVLGEILVNDGKALPRGERGIIFSANGRHSWTEVAQQAAQVCYEAGKITESKVQHITLAEAVEAWGKLLPGFDEQIIELGLSSNSRTLSTVGRHLGWKPSRGEEAWKAAFREDLEAVTNQK